MIVTNSNLVLADCPQMMEESTMKQSDNRMLKEDHVLMPTVYQDSKNKKVRCALPTILMDGTAQYPKSNSGEQDGILRTHRKLQKRRNLTRSKKTIEDPPGNGKSSPLAFSAKPL